MLEKICLNFTNALRKKDPDITDEKAEIINFAFLVFFGEGPKILAILLIAWLLNILDLTLITFIATSIYRTQSGGFHLDGHLSCFFTSLITFCGIGLVAKAIVTTNIYLLYTLYALVFIFDLLVIHKYAPADTDKIPIISEEYRNKKRRNSYIAIFILYIFALFISPNQIISNICVLSTFMQSVTMTETIYKISKCEYGEVSRLKLNLIKNT